MFGLDYSTFLEKNLVAIFVIYGCSFFYLFLSILFSFKSLRAIGLSAAFGYLMLFALTHATVEWMDMYLQYARLVHDQGAGPCSLTYGSPCSPLLSSSCSPLVSG